MEEKSPGVHPQSERCVDAVGKAINDQIDSS